MKKKIIIICLFIAFLIQSISNASYEPNIEDIKLKKLVYCNILDGYSNGEYRLKELITRAEFSKMVYILIRGTNDLGKPFLEQENAFVDLIENGRTHWAKGYIMFCVQEGYLKGKTKSLFKPEEYISVSEICTILLRSMGIQKEEREYKEKETMIMNTIEKKEEQYATREDVCKIIYDLLPPSSGTEAEDYPLAISNRIEI